jgi:hypothetical protein
MGGLISKSKKATPPKVTPSNTTPPMINLTEQNLNILIELINTIDNIILPFLNNKDYTFRDIDYNNNIIMIQFDDAYNYINQMVKNNLNLFNINNNSNEVITLKEINNNLNSFKKNINFPKEQVGKKIVALILVFVDIKTIIDKYNKKNINIELNQYSTTNISIKYNTSPISDRISEFFENTNNKKIKLFLLILLFIIILIYILCEYQNYKF